MGEKKKKFNGCHHIDGLHESAAQRKSAAVCSLTPLETSHDDLSTAPLHSSLATTTQAIHLFNHKCRAEAGGASSLRAGSAAWGMGHRMTHLGEQRAASGPRRGAWRAGAAGSGRGPPPAGPAGTSAASWPEASPAAGLLRSSSAARHPAACWSVGGHSGHGGSDSNNSSRDQVPNDEKRLEQVHIYSCPDRLHAKSISLAHSRTLSHGG